MSSDMTVRWCWTLLSMAAIAHLVSGHGRLMEPPSRSSMWRVGFDTPHNYDDNSLNCGGLQVQWSVNGGKCGVCGDPWGDPQPRENEAGGRYGLGIITRTYSPGQVIDVQVEITANHLGWFEFRLCPHNDPTTPVTQECLDQYLLQLADGSGTQYHIGSRSGMINLRVQLPPGVTCTQCVFQWRYHGGNNFGEIQEEFYGCSDIAISTTVSISTSPRPHTTHPVVVVPPQPCHGIGTYAGNLDVWCTQTCAHVFCDPIYCSCDNTSANPSTNTPLPPSTTPLNVPETTPLMQCHGVGSWAGQPSLDKWCTEACSNLECDPQFCTCEPSASASSLQAQTTSLSPLPSTSTLVDSPLLQCRGVGSWAGQPSLDKWCTEACSNLECDPQFCACEPSASASPSLQAQTTSLTPSPSTSTLVNSPPTTAPSLPSNQPCRAIGLWAGQAHLDLWCTEACRQTSCDPQLCSCDQTTAGSLLTTASAQIATSPLVNPPSPSHQCRAVGTWAGKANLDAWCTESCTQMACDPEYCACDPVTNTNPPFHPPTTADQLAPSQPCQAVGEWSGQRNLDQWCTEACAQFMCDPQYCSCDKTLSTQPSVHSTTQAQTYPTTASPTAAPYVLGQHCHAIGAWAGQPNLDLWCTQTCSHFLCDPQYCVCDQDPITQSDTPHSPSPTQTSVPSPQPVTQTFPLPTTAPLMPSSTPQQRCHAVGSWAGLPQLDVWCNEACIMFPCDPQYCSCDPPIDYPTVQTLASSSPTPLQTTLPPTTQQVTHLSPTTPQPTTQQSTTLPTTTAQPETSTTTTVITLPSTPAPNTSCHGINNWQGVSELDQYCAEQCPLGNCPPLFCSCSVSSTTVTTHLPETQPPSTPILTTSVPPSTTTTTPSPSSQGVSMQCDTAVPWKGVVQLVEWCNDNCPTGLCPPQYCDCSNNSQSTPLQTTLPPTTQQETHLPPTTPQPTTQQPTTLPTTMAQPETSTTTTVTMVQTTSPSTSSITTLPPTTTTSTIITTVVPQVCVAAGQWAGTPELDQWCMDNCLLTQCPPNTCTCQPATLSTPSSTPIFTTTTMGPQECVAAGQWAGTPQLDQWCMDKCNLAPCPPSYCTCHPAITTILPFLSKINCYSVNEWAGVPELDEWCTTNCMTGHCPNQYCGCSNSNTTTASAAATESPTSPTQIYASSTQPLINNTTTASTAATESPTSPTQIYASSTQPLINNTTTASTAATESPTSPTQIYASSTQPLINSLGTTPDQNASKCHSVGIWQGIPDLDEWCANNCATSTCPTNYCTCDP